jgi:membrane protein involved in colicin uptake
MPNHYITYALAALSFGLGVAFLRISDENTNLVQAKTTIEMEASALREKYNGEIKARQFAEAAQTIAETSERAVRNELAHETKARQAAETAKQSVEAALLNAEDKLHALNAKLIEAGLAPAEAVNADTQAEAKAPAEKGEPAADAKDPNARADAGQMAAEASMGGARRSWWSLFGF